MSDAAAIATAVQAGDDSRVRALVGAALDAEAPAARLLDDGLLAGMAVVGRRFKAREVFLPDVLLAARALQAGMELLRPRLLGDAGRLRGRVVLATVRGDIHDIGKNLVGIMLQGAGFDVVDLGKDVPAEAVVQAALEHDARVVGLSALLTTTMVRMKDVVDLVRARGLSGRIRVIVGGAPLTAAFAAEIGADAWAPDAASAADRVAELLDGRPACLD